MFYPNLKFSKLPKSRPFFYTNFVQTVDGKVAVSEKGYWPIGSKKDYQVLLELRSHADCLIHGGNLAREFGEITLKSIHQPTFKKMRGVLGKNINLPYYILTKHPKTLNNLKPLGANIISGGLVLLIEKLQKKKFKHVLMEGGPTLLGSSLKMGLIDEVFLTIAPKIYGSKPNSTKTLVEGILLPPNNFKLKLISVKRIKNELFLRYQVS